MGPKPSRYAQALAAVPGNNPTVLEAFACTDGTPAEISAGSAMNDPPPARAFMAPASSPAPRMRKKEFTQAAAPAVFDTPNMTQAAMMLPPAPIRIGSV